MISPSILQPWHQIGHFFPLLLTEGVAFRNPWWRRAQQGRRRLMGSWSEVNWCVFCPFIQIDFHISWKLMGITRQNGVTRVQTTIFVFHHSIFRPFLWWSVQKNFCVPRIFFLLNCALLLSYDPESWKFALCIPYILKNLGFPFFFPCCSFPSQINHFPCG